MKIVEAPNRGVMRDYKAKQNNGNARSISLNLSLFVEDQNGPGIGQTGAIPTFRSTCEKRGESKLKAKGS